MKGPFIQPRARKIAGRRVVERIAVTRTRMKIMGQVASRVTERLEIRKTLSLDPSKSMTTTTSSIHFELSTVKVLIPQKGSWRRRTTETSELIVLVEKLVVA